MSILFTNSFGILEIFFPLFFTSLFAGIFTKGPKKPDSVTREFIKQERDVINNAGIDAEFAIQYSLSFFIARIDNKEITERWIKESGYTEYFLKVDDDFYDKTKSLISYLDVSSFNYEGFTRRILMHFPEDVRIKFLKIISSFFTFDIYLLKGLFRNEYEVAKYEFNNYLSLFGYKNPSENKFYVKFDWIPNIFE